MARFATAIVRQYLLSPKLLTPRRGLGKPTGSDVGLGNGLGKGLSF